MDGWLKAADGFAPKRPIGGCPTGTPATACPDDVARIEFKLLAFVASRAGRDVVEPTPKPAAALGLAVWFRLKIVSVVGTCTNPNVPEFVVDCGTVE